MHNELSGILHHCDEKKHRAMVKKVVETQVESDDDDLLEIA